MNPDSADRSVEALAIVRRCPAQLPLAVGGRDGDARQGERAMFDELAPMVGVRPEDRDAVWTGARARLGLENPA